MTTLPYLPQDVLKNILIRVDISNHAQILSTCKALRATGQSWYVRREILVRKTLPSNNIQLYCKRFSGHDISTTRWEKASANLQAVINQALKWGGKKMLRQVVDRMRYLSPKMLSDVFLQCCMLGLTDIVKYMLHSKLGDPTVRDNMAIRMACRDGDTSIVEVLLDDPNVDADADDGFCIIISSIHGRSDIVKILLANGRVNPAVDDNYALEKACENGHQETVKLLLECGDIRIDPAVDDFYPLRSASKNGHVKVVQILIRSPLTDSEDDKEVLRQMLNDSSLRPVDDFHARSCMLKILQSA